MRASLLAALAAALAGCATAGADDEDASGGGDDVVDAAPTIDAPPSPPGTPDAAPGQPDAAPVPTPDAAPTGDGCASGATCIGATPLGNVSGDTGNAKLTASGTQAAWYRVRVTEDDNDIFGLSLRVAARLTSPAGADFDVFVYMNTGADTLDCATTVGSTSTNGATNEVKAEWGESSVFANGAEDGRDVSIEVRPISGTCSAGSIWQLEIEGNWQ